MSTLQPYEIALQAGEVAAHALKPFVERHAPTPGDPGSWSALIARADAKRLGRHDPDYLLTDPRVLLKAIRFHPEQFGGRFTAHDQEWAETALQTLHLAHGGRAVSRKTVSTGIEAMQLLLESVGAETAARRLEAVDDEQFDDFEAALRGLTSDLAEPSVSELSEPTPSSETPPAADATGLEQFFDGDSVPQESQPSPSNHLPDEAATGVSGAELDAAEVSSAESGPAPLSNHLEELLGHHTVPRGCSAADFCSGPVVVRVVYRNALNFALIHNRVSPIHDVIALHTDHEGDHTVEVTVAFGETDDVTADPLRIGPIPMPKLPEQKSAFTRSCPPSEVAWQIGPQQFAQLDEARTTTLRLNVLIDGEQQSQTHHIELLARDEWHAQLVPESLAAFVTPNSSALMPVLHRASELLEEKTGSSALSGYQEGPERVRQIAESVYDALAEKRLTYINPPASFEGTGQKIRRIEDMLEHRMGTCLDLSVLYAAALEQAGIHPVVVLVPGHAFAGYLAHDEQLAQPVLEDRGMIDNVVRTARLVPVETTRLAETTPVTFEQACRASAHHFDAEVNHVLDIASVHRRFKPLPRFVQGPMGVVEMHTERAPATPLPSPDAAMVHEEDSVHRYRASQEQLLPPRIRKWRQSLLDLSLRNPLLSLKKSALELIMPERSLADFEDLLSSGSRILLRATDDLSDIGRAAGFESARSLGDDALDQILRQEKTAYVGLLQGSYGTRLQNLHRTARSAVDETGSNLLFVTLGALSWRTTTGKEALAPLFLLPAKLEGSKKHRFHLSIEEGAEAQPNWVLIEKLRTEFALEIPVLEEPPEDEHGIDVPRVLHEVRTALAKSKHPFAVKPDVRLAILQFASIEMWRDLGAHWESFLENPVVHHLVEEPYESFQDSIETVPVTAELEAKTALPVPVDGSQLEAITWAGAGRTFVLEGPPGTGKSQTITNMIAEALNRGKTVLFVAEKQAALDVVRTRLQRVGLDPLTLQMHGKRQTVADVRRQLLESWDAEAVGNAASFRALRDEYRRLIRDLDAYPRQLHDSPDSQPSVWEAHQNYIGSLSRLSSSTTDAAGLHVPARVIRDKTLIDGIVDLADRVVNALRPLGETPLNESPWLLAGPAGGSAASSATTLETASQPESAVVASPMAAVRGFLKEYDSLGAEGRELLTRYPDARAWAHLAAWQSSVARGVYMSVAHHREVWTRTPRWDREMQSFIQQIQELWNSLGHLLPHLRMTSRDADVEDLREQLHSAESRFIRKQKAIDHVLQRMEPLVTPGNESLVWDDPRAFLNGLGWAQAQTAHLSAEAARLLPADTPWDPWSPRTVEIPRIILECSDVIGTARRWFSDEDLEGLSATGTNIDVASYHSAWDQLLDALGSTPASLARWQRDDSVLEAIDRSVEGWRAQAERDRSSDLNRFRRADRAVADLEAEGFESLGASLRRGEEDPSDLPARIKLATARDLLADRLDESELSSFDPVSRHKQVDRFISQGEHYRDALRQELPAALLKRRRLAQVGTLTGEQTRLRREIERRRGGSIRGIFEAAGSAVQDVTPCMLMSPASVAKHLPVGSIRFDLVIFDEASQIRVADSIGSMGRADSVVIVGDSQQMPPSSMFAAGTSEDDDLDEESGATAADQESILTEAVSANIEQKMLTWHYRSQDESLIAYSNQRYYQGGLSTFPAPPIPRPGLGIRLVDADGTFDGSRRGETRKATRTNEVEAQRIVADIIARLHEDPEASIGVVTFNVQQQERIQDLLEDEESPAVRDALAREVDPLIVKNLENIQGDERDIILFSLAFSPNPETRKMSMNFGPLSRQGGQRRLNVAITRARREVMLYTSFAPEDIDLARTSSEGMRHLREYLEFARDQTEAEGTPQLRRPSPELHRQDVAATLREAGLEVVEEYGLSKFQVDLAIRRPDSDLWFAVMLDGKSWARRPIVSDRDAVPAQVLTRMGWSQVLPVWLPSWWHNRQAAVDSLLRHIDEAISAAAKEGEPTRADEPTIAPEPNSEPADAPSRSSEPMKITEEMASPREAVPEPPTEGHTASVHSPEHASEVPSTSQPEAQPSPVHTLVEQHALPFPTASHAAPSASRPSATRGTIWNPDTIVTIPFQPVYVEQVGRPDHLYDLRGSRQRQARVKSEMLDLIEKEGPISQNRLLDMMRVRYGIGRLTLNRRTALLEALDGPRFVQSHTRFYWPRGVDQATWQFVRTPAGDRSIADISGRELENAVVRMLNGAPDGLDWSVLQAELNTLFGFGRTGRNITGAYHSVVDGLVAQGRVQREDSVVRLTDS